MSERRRELVHVRCKVWAPGGILYLEGSGFYQNAPWQWQSGNLFTKPARLTCSWTLSSLFVRPPWPKPRRLRPHQQEVTNADQAGQACPVRNPA